MRVVAGKYGGRRILAPKGRSTRPTADRVRESLFSRLGDLEGRRVLDLFAGSGSLGLEALSRGAKSAVFIDQASTAITAVRANINSLKLGDRCQVIKGAAKVELQRFQAAGVSFHLVFLDPPYGAELSLDALVGVRPLLEVGGEAILESSAAEDLVKVPGFKILDERSYGQTRITRYNAEPG